MSCEIGTQWRIEKDGSRTCPHCGSLHPDDMIDIMYRYVAGEEGYHFDLTTKRYKLYGNRPGVQNAGDGGIKFYTNHITDEVRTEFEAAYALAVPVYRMKFKERWGTDA